MDQHCFLTYVWIDGTGEGLRSKTKVAKKEPTDINQISEWGYDGSSCYQATGEDSDLEIRPVRMCPDPFMTPKSKLVLCDVYDAKGNPVVSNKRNSALDAFNKCKDQDPTFGFEQEYTLLGNDGRPYGFPSVGLPGPQGPYYCSAGAEVAMGRDVNDSHLYACQYAELSIWGTNGEVMPGQWEFQTGPLIGVEGADQLWLGRYILQRVAEEFGITVTLDPKPAPGDWNGAGCHTNFNTGEMFDEGGIKHVHDAIAKLAKRHQKHIEGYDPKGGKDNIRRLTGEHETARIDQFSSGEAARTASIRIPRAVAAKGKGFLEDRRPAANMDPYVVSDLLMRTVCLNE
jgi:glutamine synthetase